MNKILIPVFMAFIALLLVFYGSCFAVEPPKPIPITANQAFDAVQAQIDPLTEVPKAVALIDVRTRAEFFWVGAACQVDEIITKKEKIYFPDLGKVTLSKNGRLLFFRLNKRKKHLRANKISEVVLTPIAINVPFWLWDENTAKLVANPNFTEIVEGLSKYYDVLIFYCRSGGRSENCLGSFNTHRFEAIYEIDQPDGKNGKGGFEGPSYTNVYIGYRGFPERWTSKQEHPSVSWKDAGLPIKTSVNPFGE